MATYIPRVLICGDTATFGKIIGDKPVKVVGQIFFRRAGGESKIFYNGQPLDDKTVRYLPDNFAEYLLFTDALEFDDFLKTFPLNIRAMSARAFAEKNHGGFYSVEMLVDMCKVLNKNFSGRVLDFDGFLVKSDFRTKFELTMPTDCVAEKIFPIMQNVFDKIYRTFDDCKYHIFDAVILSKERTPAEFVDALIQTDALGKNILAFMRRDSELASWLETAQKFLSTSKLFALKTARSVC